MISYVGMYSQEGYTAKKEFGYNNRVKSVKTYTMNVGRYTIPTDTIDYFHKSILKFTIKGDILTHYQFMNQPSYKYKSIIKYTGVGKNLYYTEDLHINDTLKSLNKFKYDWINDFEYNIKSELKSEIRSVTLNNDFTVKTVVLIDEEFQSTEHATYYYNNDVLDYIVFENITIKNNISESRSTKHEVKSVDVYNNPTVIYVYKNLHIRVPSTVILKYYEYY